MELRQLEHFLAVVEEGSFSAAAARLFMVQSSLSASLLTLERKLGTELFIRGRRGAELTDAGRALLEPARAVLQSVDEALDAVAEVKGLLRGTVRIAALAVPPSIDICQTLRQFREDHPEVEVEVVAAEAKAMLDMVADGHVDFAVAPRVEPMASTVRFEPLVSTPLAVICPRDHRLAGARDVDPRDLVDENIIDLSRAWLSRQLFDTLLQECGVQRKIRLEVHDFLAVPPMVQGGVGISYGAYTSVDIDSFDGVGVATLAGAPQWEFGIATRDDALRGAAGRALLAAYRRRCATAPARWSW